tara:strand:+ start:1148 stop:1735 length:588 start_codon:yes stop_codon:yes gene_type:complete
MSKKLTTQIILVLTIISLILLFFFFYFPENKNIDLVDGKPEELIDKNESNQNIIKEIRYTSKDDLGNSYVIFSDYGKINLDNPDLIFMTNVVAIINLKDSDEIQINSNYANFNNKSYETEFFDKVVITRAHEKITAEKLDFSLEKNLVLLSNDVIFYKPGYNLKADKVEIDLITKNSKILMNNKNKKVIIIGDNK